LLSEQEILLGVSSPLPTPQTPQSPYFAETYNQPVTDYRIKEKRKYIQAELLHLICSVQVHEDVDGGNHHLGEDEDDDDPFQ
jgi:hypothetical protein